jgi:N-hydroxyarylamine O-acetyltransferase
MDLPAYFSRIGYDGPQVASHAVLADIVLQHTLSIPFENLDAYLGRRISLEPEAVEHKLVAQRRGGWCFEQNLLLGNALRELGFEVTDLAGRVVWGRAADAVVPRTHRVLCVRVEGREWLVDVGFGGQTPTAPLDLHSLESQATPHEPFRLRALGNERVLESLVDGDWVWLYRFDSQPQLHVDFEAANYQLVHDPASHFTQGLRAARVTRAGRDALRGLELVSHSRAGATQCRELDSMAAVLDALRDVFGLEVGDLPGLRERIAAQIGSAARS